MKRASAKARREARAQMRQVVFEAMASGFSIEEIADMRKVSPRTIRREVDRTLNERRLDAPERYVHFQVARLNKAVRVADAGLDRGELRAISPMIKAVKELDRYHGLARGLAGAADGGFASAPAAAPARSGRRGARRGGQRFRGPLRCDRFGNPRP
jgi:AraC-like DNA-binding protein